MHVIRCASVTAAAVCHRETVSQLCNCSAIKHVLSTEEDEQCTSTNLHCTFCFCNWSFALQQVASKATMKTIRQKFEVSRAFSVLTTLVGVDVLAVDDDMLLLLFLTCSSPGVCERTMTARDIQARNINVCDCCFAGQ